MLLQYTIGTPESHEPRKFTAKVPKQECEFYPISHQNDNCLEWFRL